jgi:hypothetical protein
VRIGGRGKKGAAHGQDVFHITDAPKPLSQDIRSREAKYLMAMGVRVVAFILVVFLPIDWPWKIGLAVLALVLPYVAVVYANGGREPAGGATDRYQDPQRLELTRGETRPEESGPVEPLVGTIVDDAPEPADAADPDGGHRKGDPRHTPDS